MIKMTTTVDFTNDTPSAVVPAFKYYSPISSAFGYKYTGFYYPTATFPPSSNSGPPTSMGTVAPSATANYDVSDNCCDSSNSGNQDQPCRPACEGCHEDSLNCNEMFIITGYGTDNQQTYGPMNLSLGTNTVKASDFFGIPWKKTSPSSSISPLQKLSPSEASKSYWGWVLFSFAIVFISARFVGKLDWLVSIGIAIAAVIVTILIEKLDH